MIKAKVILFTSKKMKDGTHPLMLRLTKGTARKYLAIGYNLNESEWNSNSGKVVGRSPKSKELQHIIERIELNALQKIQMLEVGLDEAAQLLGATTESKYVLDYWQGVVSKLSETGKKGNAQAYRNTLGAFKKFRKDKDIEFASLNYKTVKTFEEFLQTNGLQTNGISFHMRTLRALYNRAIKDGLTNKENYPFEKYKIKKEKTQHRALTKEDIKTIRDCELETDGQRFARDIFMFSFYMRGMSFVDIAFIKVENIHQNRLQYRRAKTGQIFSIKLTDEANEIIARYTDFSNPQNYVFPIVQNEITKYDDYSREMRRTNRRLKKIGKSLNLTLPLTTYVARHSWATIAKRGGTSVAVISEGMGHATEHITQVYLDSFENSVLDDANELITKLD